MAFLEIAHAQKELLGLLLFILDMKEGLWNRCATLLQIDIHSQLRMVITTHELAPLIWLSSLFSGLDVIGV
jgi:hypothetical protein